MKKICIVLLVIIVLVSLCGCSNNTSSNDDIVGKWKAYGVMDERGKITHYKNSLQGEELKDITDRVCSFDEDGNSILKSKGTEFRGDYIKKKDTYVVVYEYDGFKDELIYRIDSGYLIENYKEADKGDMPLVYERIG